VGRLDFFDHLRQSRLLPDAQVEQLATRFAEPDSVRAIADVLIAEHVLTPFQAKQLLAKKGQRLGLGQYRLLEEIGQGGFGRVYKARHVVMDRVVALKVIALEYADDAAARNWFRREVLAATRVQHPNIVMAFDANEEDGVLYLVMEFVEGMDLDTMIRRQGPLPISLACEIIRQAARALEHAAELGLVHRDIKPANLLIGHKKAADENPSDPRHPVVKVTDFGLARLHGLTKNASLVSSGEGAFLGSPFYVSPEQAQSASDADIRSDLYSLGCTFYYALAGQKPFNAATPLQVIVKHMQAEPEPLQKLRPEVPSSIAAIVHRLLEKDPARRFQTPTELLSALELVGEMESTTPDVSPPPLRPTPIHFTAASLQERTRFVAQLASEAASWEQSAKEKLDDFAHPRPASGTATVALRSGLASAPARDAGNAREPLPVPETSAEVQNEETAPRTTAGRVFDLASLKRSWQEWFSVIDFLAGGGDHRRIATGGYRALHTNLLAFCRAGVESGEEARRGFYARMESLVEPWLTPEALAQSDSGTLQHLLQTCRGIERELCGPPQGVWKVGLALLICLVLAVITGWHLSQLDSSSGSIRSGISSLWDLVRSSPFLSLVLFLPFALLLPVYLLTRTRRRAGE
jgi:serine/threonine protein kinase